MDFIYSKGNIVEASKLVIKESKTNHYFIKGIVGAGKTTLIKQIFYELGVKETVNSPTFSIINEYKAKNKTVYHMDLFRLDDKKEVYNLGILDYLDNDDLIIISIKIDSWLRYSILLIYIFIFRICKVFITRFKYFTT